jgi:hypothetical protein
MTLCVHSRAHLLWVLAAFLLLLRAEVHQTVSGQLAGWSTFVVGVALTLFASPRDQLLLVPGAFR